MKVCTLFPSSVNLALESFDLPLNHSNNLKINLFCVMISNGLGKKASLFPRPFIIQPHYWTFSILYSVPKP